AMGADIVLAVDLGSDLVGRYARDNDHPNGFMSRIFPRYNPTSGRQVEPEIAPPSLIESLVGAINIMQLRIARSRLAGEPPDVLVTPRLGQLGLLDYHRAEFAIAEGRDEVTRMLPAIRNAIPEQRAGQTSCRCRTKPSMPCSSISTAIAVSSSPNRRSKAMSTRSPTQRLMRSASRSTASDTAMATAIAASHSPVRCGARDTRRTTVAIAAGPAIEGIA